MLAPPAALAELVCWVVPAAGVELGVVVPVPVDVVGVEGG
jgi:hypothetical protein